MRSIDAKLALRDPVTWQALSTVTCIVPFAAIFRVRNLFIPHEAGWLTFSIAVFASAATLFVHPWLVGVAAIAL